MSDYDWLPATLFPTRVETEKKTEGRGVRMCGSKVEGKNVDGRRAADCGGIKYLLT